MTSESFLSVFLNDKLRGAEKMQGLEEGTLPDGRKTQRQVPNRGRERTCMVQAEGELLLRVEACLYSKNPRAG